MAKNEPTDQQTNLAELLAEFNQKVNRLPELREPPATTLQILGSARHERAWQALLFHFLSPDATHGLGTDLLEHLLEAIADREDLSFEYSRFDLDAIRVETEVVASDSRRPDAVIWSEEDWFICFELKVGASEGGDQTNDYVEVGSFAGIGLDKQTVPSDGHHYIYVAPGGGDAPSADAFVKLTWEWIASELQSFLAASQGGYPARTTAQLADFIDTIRTELTMTEYRESQEEKAELYLEYFDAIEEARAAFERNWEAFQDDWGERLVETLDAAEVRDAPELGGAHIAIELPESPRGPERWIFRQGQSDWAGLIKEGWWRRKEDGSVVHRIEESSDEYRLSVCHRLSQNRELAIRDSVLELQWWHGTANGDEFMYTFKDILYPKLEAAGDTVPGTVEMTGRRGNPLNARYDIPVSDHGDFFDAYVAALRDAFLEIVIDSDLIGLVDEAYEETLETIDPVDT
jgi:hypothetical protein